MLYCNSLNLYTGLLTSNFNVFLDLPLSKIVIIVFSIFSILLSLNFLKAEKINDFEYIVLILFSIFGIVVLVSANDLLITYVSIEIRGLSLYILISIKKNTLYSTEAGLKYFVLGSLASILLLFGFLVFMVYLAVLISVT
jgi:NADH-quinone oxidoreductase subunit N